MSEQKLSPAQAAFFRWQEWLACRRHVTPGDAQTRSELYAAEAVALTAAGETLAARDAHELARTHAAAPPAGEAPTTGSGRPSEVEIADSPTVRAAAENFAQQIDQLRRLIARLNPTQARSVLRTMNALPETLAWGRADPTRVLLVPVPVQPARRGFDITPMVVGLSGLRQRDPLQFRSMMALVQGQSDATQDDKFVDWLKGSELP